MSSFKLFETKQGRSLWEKINNPNFKRVQFDPFKSEAGCTLFTSKWIEATGVIGNCGHYS